MLLCLYWLSFTLSPVTLKIKCTNQQIHFSWPSWGWHTVHKVLIWAHQSPVFFVCKGHQEMEQWNPSMLLALSSHNRFICTVLLYIISFMKELLKRVKGSQSLLANGTIQLQTVHSKDTFVRTYVVFAWVLLLWKSKIVNFKKIY